MIGARKASAMFFGAMMFLSLLFPTSYVVESPGLVINVMGQEDDRPIIDFSNSSIFQSNTRLYMTTVSSSGDPQLGAFSWQVAAGLLMDGYQVIPVRLLYPEETSVQVHEKTAKQMLNSQETAAVMGVEKAGYHVTMKLTISGCEKGSEADEKLQAGDHIISLSYNGKAKKIDSFAALNVFLSSVPVGKEVEITYMRGDEERKDTITTLSFSPNTVGYARAGSRLGISVNTEDVQMPLEVNFHLGDIGGPSAGLMLSIGVYDYLTQGSLGETQKIAGTGTISLSGEVGAIGGIKHKMQGAKNEGARYFIAPALNCDDVVGNVPSGLSVYAVHTLDQAIYTVRSIGRQDVTGLLTCEMVVNKSK
ncbi:MAG: pdz/dhr/glgf protein [Actinomycetaceae bacterium]|nr:pdz/dhr/glgf protein [Actinomycetaceae bacterium]